MKRNFSTKLHRIEPSRRYPSYDATNVLWKQGNPRGQCENFWDSNCKKHNTHHWYCLWTCWYITTQRAVCSHSQKAAETRTWIDIFLKSENNRTENSTAVNVVKSHKQSGACCNLLSVWKVLFLVTNEYVSRYTLFLRNSYPRLLPKVSMKGSIWASWCY